MKIIAADKTSLSFLLCLLLLSFTGASLAQSTSNSGVANDILEASNTYRVKNGFPKLTPHPALMSAASSHSAEMVELNYFSHTSPTPQKAKVLDRIKLAGLSPQSVAENIYGSTGFTPAIMVGECLKSWIESSGHRANMLNPKYTHIGVGVANRGDFFRVTQVFAGGDLQFEVAAKDADAPSSATSADSVADTLFEETNKRRGDIGLPLFQIDPFLQRAAQDHSKEMLQLKYFSHQSPTPERAKLRQRVRLAGADPMRLAENIYKAGGYARNTVALRAILAFMESPGHRDNILNSDHTRIGIGVYEADGEFYITQVFSGD